MVIVWGSGMYGKVDKVPNICHVATRFGHLYYIPLIPLASYAIVEQVGEDFRGAQIPLSLKSILVAWLWAGAIVGLIGSVVGGFLAAREAEILPILMAALLAVTCVALIVFILTAGFLKNASYERARQLGEHLRLTPEGVLMLEVAYGRMSAGQADAALQRLEQQAQEAHAARQAELARQQGLGEQGHPSGAETRDDLQHLPPHLRFPS